MLFWQKYFYFIEAYCYQNFTFEFPIRKLSSFPWIYNIIVCLFHYLVSVCFLLSLYVYDIYKGRKILEIIEKTTNMVSKYSKNILYKLKITLKSSRWDGNVYRCQNILIWFQILSSVLEKRSLHFEKYKIYVFLLNSSSWTLFDLSLLTISVEGSRTRISSLAYPRK